MIEQNERLARTERDVAACGREIGEVRRRVDDQAAMLVQMKDMNGHIMVLAEQMKQLARGEAKLDGRLAALEARPARRWDAVVGALIAGVVGAVVGLLGL